MGEIALALWRDHLRQNPVRLGPDTRRELGNVANRTGLSMPELKEFFKGLLEKAVEKTFSS